MKISVLIPVFNTKPDALLESVYSILRQDDGVQHDIIIIDDASTDYGTIQAINSLRKNSYPIKILTLEENGGTSVALNKGHRMVETEFVAIQGSDDVSDRSRFRLQIDYLKKNRETDVLGTNLFSFRDQDIRRTPIFTSSHPEKPIVKNTNWIVNHGTVIYRQEAVLKTGGYNPSFKRAQDVDLWGRMYSKGFVFRNITEVLYAWRHYNK